MGSDSSGQFDKARNYAFLLLKFRPRSENELLERLKKKKFSEELSRQVVAFLREKKFLDDDDFARAWIDFRLRRPFGIRRIKQELILKGIDEDIIARQISVSTKDYSEKSVVVNLAKQRMDKLKNLPADKAQRRIFAYLVRRGFSLGTINEVMKQVE